MNIFNTFNDARKYFEVIAAYNIDRFRFQSMVSTAHKMLTLQRAIEAGKSLDEIGKGFASVSEYWFYKTKHSVLFAPHLEALNYVWNWCQTHGLMFDNSPENFETDTYCRHMLVMSPYSGGFEVFDLESGRTYAVATLPTSQPVVAKVAVVEGKPVPLYNFTRRECDVKVGGLISHQASH